MKGKFPVMYTKYTKKSYANFLLLIAVEPQRFWSEVSEVLLQWISASLVFQYVAYWKLYFNLEVLPSIFFFVDVVGFLFKIVKDVLL